MPTPAASMSRSVSARNLWTLELRKILLLGGSLSLGQIARVLAAMVNVIMMGWIGVQALAAGALINSVVLLLFLTCSGVLQGTAPMIGSGIGAKQYDFVSAVMRHGVLIAVALSVVSALLLAVTPAVLSLTGQDPAIAAQAKLYAWVSIAGLFPSLWLMCVRYFLAAVEEVRWLNIIMILGVAVGAYGNYLFIFGKHGLPALGLVGIGLSTGIANWLMLFSMLAVLSLSSRLRRYSGFGLPWPINWPILTTALRIGGPIGVVLFVETALFAGAHAMMGYIDVAALAGHAIVVQLFYLVLMVPLGLSQAATARVAHAVGRGLRREAIAAGIASVMITLAFVGVVGGAMFFYAEDIVRLALRMRGDQSVGVLFQAVAFTEIAALTQALSGAVVVMAGVMRGCRDTAFAMLYVIVGYWVIGLGSAFVFAFGWGMGGEGIWWGLTGGFAFSIVTLVWRFLRLGRRIDDAIDGTRDRVTGPPVM